MDLSAIIMLIFGVVVLYGGLIVTVNKAVKSTKKNDN
ncbi:MAG: MetS family NSS transporter small subunit [Halanaerobiales bacterium]